MKTIIGTILFTTSILHAATWHDSLSKAKQEASKRKCDILVAIVHADEASDRLKRELKENERSLAKSYALAMWKAENPRSPRPVLFMMRKDGKPFAREEYKKDEKAWIIKSIKRFEYVKQEQSKLKDKANKAKGKERANNLIVYLLAVRSEVPLVGYDKEIDELAELMRRHKIDSKLAKAVVTDAYVTRIRDNLMLRKTKAAIKAADMLLRHEKDDFFEQVALGYRAVAFWMEGKREEAIREAEKALAKDPKGSNSNAIKALIRSLKKNGPLSFEGF